MNRTKIEWADWTFNPVTGCRGGCPYCYARRIATRFKGTKAFPNGFEPTFHPKRLDQPAKAKKPSRIFVGSMADLGGEWNDPTWLWATIEASKKASWHRYILLTKYPQGLRTTRFPPFWWVGVSASTPEEAKKRIYFLNAIDTYHQFLCLEPLFNWDIGGQLAIACAEWLIIGSQTGPNAEKTRLDIAGCAIDHAERFGKPVFLKDNLNWPVKRQEYPKELILQK